MPAFSVKVLAEVVVAGLKTAVTPLGTPDAERLTDPPKPFCGVILIAVLTPLPRVTVKAAGDAARV